MKTPDDVHEAQDLLQAHSSLRWNIARNGNKRISLYAHDDDEKTAQPSFPPEIGRRLMALGLALVETRLRELGVEPEQGLKHECFECCGEGEVPIK